MYEHLFFALCKNQISHVANVAKTLTYMGFTNSYKLSDVIVRGNLECPAITCRYPMLPFFVYPLSKLAP